LVLKSTLKEARMAHHDRKAGQKMTQGTTLLLDDPSFLREIVERVLQELLEVQR
jgi:hypothetical protein